MDVADNFDTKRNTSEIDLHNLDDSNKVIAPVRENRNFNNDIYYGGDWENHPRGEYVLLCHEHLSHIQGFIENWEHISDNLPMNSLSDKLEEKVRSALANWLKLYNSVADIVALFNDPDYSCPEDYA